MLNKDIKAKIEDSYKSWQEINGQIPLGHPARLTHGHFSVGCQILGTARGLTTDRIIEGIQGCQQLNFLL